ncbi:MAG: hypothetical protein IT380_03985 [Myxococcales bacterium]|nr:hypothetical protein [Myxococcales bacterium]
MTSPRAWLLVAALAAPLAFAQAQPAPHVTQVLSSRQVKLGEPFELDVSVTHPKGQRWALEVPNELGAFTVLERKTATAPDGAHAVTHLVLKLGLYEPGKHVVPAMTLREALSGQALPLSQDAEVEGLSTLAKDDPGTLRDVAPPRPLFELDPTKVAAAVGAALVGLGLLLLSARVLRRSWRKLFPPESEEARDRRLLGGLAALDDERFYDALDGILRRSLARWHGVPALERTAEEIARVVQDRPPAGVAADALVTVLRDGVRVRFAHLPSTEVRRRAALEVCGRLFPAELSKKGGVRHARPALS